MTSGRLVFVILRAAVFALILAVPFRGSELVSVGVWLALAVVLVAVNLLAQTIKVAEAEAAPIAVAWTWRPRRKRRQTDPRPWEVRAIEGMVMSARDKPRVHAKRLRPRLAAMADHFLPIRQGIDPKLEPARVNALLGDVAWLIDPEVWDRTPTVGEIDVFLDTILAEGKNPAPTPRPESR